MVDAERPWHGIGPLEAAALGGTLSANVSAALANEAGTPTGYVLPLPKDGNDDTLDTLKADIRGLKGGLAFAESVSQGWAGTPNAAVPGVTRDWQTSRIGESPPDAMIQLAAQATTEVLAACGVPVELTTGGDGTSLREAYRRFLHATIAPLGRIVMTELRDKLHPSIGLGFDRLFAADVSGRARAFQSLVGGGMDVRRPLRWRA